VLELAQNISLPAYVTTAEPPSVGQEFWTKGFPTGQDAGMNACGKLGPSIEFGRLVAQGDGPIGFFIEAGFSGAPLLDMVSGVLLGVAAEATRDQSRRTAFVVPADQIERVWPPLARPYRGLSAFQEVDTRFFFGRERYIDELLSKLLRLPLVAVVGRSGSGKSSLVRAGLIPRLRSQGGWRVVTFRPGSPADNPFRNLAAALHSEMHGPIRDSGEIIRRQGEAEDLARRLWKAPNDIVPIVRAIAEQPGQREPLQILFVVDQFEELFTAVQEPDAGDVDHLLRAQFVRCLQFVTNDAHGLPPARCVLTIRADYLGRALELRELADALADADVKLGPMSQEEIKRAIEQPARSLDVSFESGLASELAYTMAHQPNALPLLEFTLAELWGRQRQRTLCRFPPGASASDMLTASLESHAEKSFDGLARRFDAPIVRKVFLDLIWLADPSREGEDTRRVRRRRSWGSGNGKSSNN
jgi:hypothetical protein